MGFLNECTMRVKPNALILGRMKTLRRNIAKCCTLLFIAAMAGCKKETEQLNLPQVADYAALQPGKVLVYHLDSTVVDQSGTQLLTTSYLVKDSTGNAYTDNTGRTSYTIYRFITDTLSTSPWQPLLTYYRTPTENSVETVDDYNLRYISLQAPVADDFSWNGNAYIDTKSTTPDYLFMDGWVYTYQNINMPYTTRKGVIDSTVTVAQIDDLSPPGDFDPSAFQVRTYSTETYAKGIGLIYKEYLHWTWQPTPLPSQYQKDSYGIKLNLVDVR